MLIKCVYLQIEKEDLVMKVKFDKTKTLNALLYVANRVQRKDFHKIFKVIYFADQSAFSRLGAPHYG